MPLRSLAVRLSLPALVCSIVACGDGNGPRAPGDHAPGPEDSASSGLPAPVAGGGSVTGMPDAAPHPVDIPATPAEPLSEARPDVDVPLDGEGVPVDAATPEAAHAETASAEPTPDDAIAVIRDYYAAINARDYDRAWRLWRGQGAASRMSAAQFAHGFADTRGVSVRIGPPGAIGVGAAQRYIEVPVTLAARHADGAQQRYIGSYTLQRTVADGASAEQRAWRIGSASIRQLE
ncbi:hypothetical protein EBB59_08690 [Lysobacter pythonis]|uniref:Lipoprotein n=1 Tax=Solilutibacter pythonis TaxID=2483112 RepID=A0A3M2HT69_9GAMM|nr:hypothetical protein [Lysobacter pythonis]RMH91013.1 hypothetical protein EBB59_08690 [Lysobacter pythonis]